MSDASPDTIHAIAENARKAAARSESLAAELAQLRGRMDGLETRLEGAQAATLAAVERLAEVQAVANRLTRLEASLGELRDETARENQERQRRFGAELKALNETIRRESDLLRRELARQPPRLEAVEAQLPRLDGLEREQAAVQRLVAVTDARIEEVAAERAGLLEEQRRADHRATVRAEEVLGQVRLLETELGTWQGRIEQQAETVRESRAIAEHMKDEAARVRQEHQQVVETQRVFEARIEGLLTALRRENEEEWERFRREREADWALLARDNEALGLTLAGLLTRTAELEVRLGLAEQDYQAGQAEERAALAALRQDVAGALAGWRLALSSATEQLVDAVTEGEPIAALDERRRATRRSLRAQRPATEG